MCKHGVHLRKHDFDQSLHKLKAYLGYSYISIIPVPNLVNIINQVWHRNDAYIAVPIWQQSASKS